MSRVGNQWTTLDGNIMEYRDRVSNRKVDTQRLPYSVQVDNLVYHSNMPRIRLSGQIIDLTQPLSEEHKEILRQTLPKSTGESVQQFQMDFKKESERKTAEARTKFFRETEAGKKKAFDIRFEQYLKDHPEDRVFQAIVDGLVKFGDFVIPLGKYIGVPDAVLEIYKSFAPPGSKFYKKGTIGDKFKSLAVDQVKKQVDRVKGDVLKNQIGKVGEQFAGETGKMLGERIAGILNEPKIKELLKEPAVKQATQGLVGSVPFKL